MLFSRERRPSRGILRAGLALVASIMMVAGVSACAADSGNSTDVADQGYQSGDGSVRTWAPNERGQSVTLTGTDYAGQPVDSGEFSGKVVVLNTWYAACPPCRAEAPTLLEVQQKYASQDVQFLGINRTDDAGAAQAFEREFSIAWPSINDESGNAIATLAGVVPVKAVPTTIVLDREGKVAARVLGQVEKSTLDSLISDVLGENA